MSGQDKSENEISYYRAEYLRTINKFEKALALYLDLPERGIDNANIRYKIGITYLNIQGKKDQSIPYLLSASEKVTRKYKNGSSFKEKKAPEEVFLYLGDAYLKNNEIDKAIQYYKRYKETTRKNKDQEVIEKRLESCLLAKELQKNPKNISFLKFPVETTDHLNFNPAISQDGNSLIYNSKRKGYIPIYYTTKKNNKWSKPRNISLEVESDGDYLVSSISANGKKIYLINQELDDDDIFVSKLSKGRWSKAISLGNKVNSIYNETHATSSSNGKYLYIVSDRLGGNGGSDIYRLVSDENGNWGQIKNLGKRINTKNNEATPFLDKTEGKLFFSSQGHNTMGGYDIFSVSLSNDSSLVQIKNIGFPINSTDDDLFFTPGYKDTIGFMSRADTINEPGQAIYMLGYFSENIIKKYKLKVQLVAKDSDKIVFSNLIVQIKGESGDLIIPSISPDQYGEFSITLPKGKYILNISGNKIYPKVKLFKITKAVSQVNNIQVEISSLEESLQKISYHIPTIYFGYNKSELNQESMNELNTLLMALNEYPGINILITGNADSNGPSDYNKDISKKRAASVMNYLVSKGIKAQRIRKLAEGENDPVATNKLSNGKDNPEGRKMNRRVSFSFSGIGSENLKTKQ
ncbi:MAG: hypothetical protein DRI73_02050 [Bacteroidetes bacterium]|nr:MAG: hypothetical protein DRI73_02050 [Bacteroidota bacterium]